MGMRKRRSTRSGRPSLVSPGRPPVAGREERRQFWAGIAAGLSSEDAAIRAGVPQAVGTRWFRKAGGMPPAMFGRSAKPLSGRYRSLAERGGACDPACAGHGHTGDRSAGRAVGVDDLAGSDALRLTGATRRCGRMCRTGWPAWSSRQVGLRLPGQQPAADGGAWRGSPLEERTCAGRARRRGGARQHRANDHQLARAASAVLDLGSGGGDVAACTAEDRHRRGGLFL